MTINKVLCHHVLFNFVITHNNHANPKPARKSWELLGPHTDKGYGCAWLFDKIGQEPAEIKPTDPILVIQRLLTGIWILKFNHYLWSTHISNEDVCTKIWIIIIIYRVLIFELNEKNLTIDYLKTSSHKKNVCVYIDRKEVKRDLIIYIGSGI